jgi:dTDP-4-dehydrorhamnose reductase
MRIVVTGADGQLGVELVRALAPQGEVVGTSIADLDVRDASCAERVAALRPDWVVHAAAATDVDGCERDAAWAFAVNGEGTRRVAEGCRRAGAGLVYVSTDYIFDGRKSTPYLEADPPAPLNVYGRSKLAGEEATRALAPRWAIVRTAWLYGVQGKNFVRTILERANAGQPLRVVDDQVGSPTYAADLAGGIALLLAAGHTGLFHVTNGGACSWFAFAREIVRLAGFDPGTVAPMTTGELDRPARRPARSVLAGAAWKAAGLPPLRPWPDALAAMLARLKAVDR